VLIFVPHATSFSFQMDSPFLPKLTSHLHFFFFFPLHHRPRHKHPNSSSPGDSSVPNIGCPGPSILFICPFVLRWETVVDRCPLSFKFSGYRQHCAVPVLSLGFQSGGLKIPSKLVLLRQDCTKKCESTGGK
jgi:hypothetical protein